MKLLTFILLLPVMGFGQAQFWNTDCSSATFLSNNHSSDVKSVSGQPDCSGSFKIYYYYHANIGSTSINALNYTTTSATTTYKVYGPFATLDAGCATNLVTAIDSSIVSSGSKSINHSLVNDRFYILVITVNGCSVNLSLNLNPTYKSRFSDSWDPQTCVDCVTGFRPGSGTYVLSAWVKDGAATALTTNYTRPYISVTSTGMTTVNLYPSGEIIDGWQRIEGELTTVTPEDMNITLNCSGGSLDCYFDDIRIFPYDASMVTYVYDPVTLRLMAELDERNYAKFYEYDEDGKLIRVKKETEKGVMTIQETRENNSKQ